MNILLINPAQLKVYGKLSPHLQLPLGLAYLGAFLRKHGYTVTVIDMHAERIAPKDLIRIIKGSFFDIVGITVATPTLNSALQVAELVKRAAPKVKVVFGGMHPSVLPKETIAYNQVDFVVKGEGEFTLLELVRAVESNGDLRGIDGLVLKSENKIVENKERKLIDNLDSLPFPARDLFKIKSYSYPDSLYAATAPIMTSRGCFGECVFCGSHCIFGRKFRARSAGNVVDEIELLARESRIKEIHIWDDSFANQKERVHQIKDEILRRNLRLKFAFPNGIRADLLDKEVMQSLKAMGTYSIAIGIESGNQAVLDKAKKHIKLEKIREAFALAREFHFETWGFFMFGIPGEEIKSAQDTIQFAKKLDPDIAKFHILKPYPGTESYDYIVNHQLLSSRNFDDYGIHSRPVHHLEGLSEKDLLRLQKKAYREFYFRPLKILKQIRRIKSYNRLKLNVKNAINIIKLILCG